MKLNIFKNTHITLLDPTIEGKGFEHNGIKYIHHSGLHHSQTAFYRLSSLQRYILLLFLIIIISCLFYNWHQTFVISLALLTFLYFTDLLFNLFLVYRGFTKDYEIRSTPEEIAAVPEDTWPTYTILCPLYKEWNIIPQFVKAMNNLNYPKDKLQIMLLLEEDDRETITNISSLSLPPSFEIHVVPHSLPKTKPKALNYGLLKAKGMYSVIYDAEDIPDIYQLKKAVMAFEKMGEKTICVQAKLNFYNPHQNILTKVFTAEYSLWFDLVLTGLQSIHAPIPLGGTSNHFRTKDLHRLLGWDSFNVTEDCDLGIRIVKLGYRTAVIDSITMEEANSNLMNWFGQRSRWIKGYIQTYLVHMRRPQEFLTHWSEPHVITFQLIVGGKVLSMFINPVMWTITILYFSLRPILGSFIESFFPPIILYMALFSLLVGNFLYMFYYMIGCYKREHDSLIKYAFLVPLYWLAMSIAAWIAIYQIFRRPHFWPKTKHGLHLKKIKTIGITKPIFT